MACLMDPALAARSKWPDHMWSKASQARLEWTREHVGDTGPLESVLEHELKIGTDCSGGEAPCFALQKLHIPYKHMFASEVATYARTWINNCTRPRKLYDDVCTRKHSKLKTIQAYFAGFPCKPWSFQNNNSEFWEDPNARPFKAGAFVVRMPQVIMYCCSEG